MLNMVNVAIKAENDIPGSGRAVGLGILQVLEELLAHGEPDCPKPYEGLTDREVMSAMPMAVMLGMLPRSAYGEDMHFADCVSAILDVVGRGDIRNVMAVIGACASVRNGEIKSDGRLTFLMRKLAHAVAGLQGDGQSRFLVVTGIMCCFGNPTGTA